MLHSQTVYHGGLQCCTVKQFIRRCLWLQSLDTSHEIPVYVFKLGGALHRVVQHNDAEVQLVSCWTFVFAFLIAIVVVT